MISEKKDRFEGSSGSSNTTHTHTTRIYSHTHNDASFLRGLNCGWSELMDQSGRTQASRISSTSNMTWLSLGQQWKSYQVDRLSEGQQCKHYSIRPGRV